MRGFGARVIVTEIDPINALQAAMEGFEVTTIEDTLGRGDIYVTTTGNCDIITFEHMQKMKDQAIVCNIGHFDNEIQVDRLNNAKGVTQLNIKPQVDKYTFPDGHSIYLLAEGRLVNLGCATAIRASSCPTPSPTRPSRNLTSGRTRTPTSQPSIVCPRSSTRKSRRLHLEKIGVKLTKLTKKQADYLGVPVEGPYKPEHYRY